MSRHRLTPAAPQYAPFRRATTTRRGALALGGGVALAALGPPGGAIRPARGGGGGTSAAATTIRVGGTGIALAAIHAVGDAFSTGHPAVWVEVLPSLGTSGGLAALPAGALDVALSARPLTEAERAAGLSAIDYARTPVAFVTHAGNTAVESLTLSDVARILTGEIVAWPDGVPVRLVRREPSDADWILLAGISAEMARAVAAARSRPGLLTVTTDQDNADALERLRGSIGAVTLGQMRAERHRLRALALDGVAPTVEEAEAGRYPPRRTLRAVTRGGMPSGPLGRFMAFMAGEEGRRIPRTRP